MDDTYIKVKGQWKYCTGPWTKRKMIDFLLRAHLDKAAPKRHFEKSIERSGEPEVVTIDKNGANLAALEAIDAGRETPTKICQSKYLNIIVEQEETQQRDTSVQDRPRCAILSQRQNGQRIGVMGRTLTDNRHGLVVNARVTRADEHAEREAAKIMIHDARQAADDASADITLGADKGYDGQEFIEACQQMRVTRTLRKTRKTPRGGVRQCPIRLPRAWATPFRRLQVLGVRTGMARSAATTRMNSARTVSRGCFARVVVRARCFLIWGTC